MVLQYSDASKRYRQNGKQCWPSSDCSSTGANSVETLITGLGQSWSGSALLCPDLSDQKLRIITVKPDWYWWSLLIVPVCRHLFHMWESQVLLAVGQVFFLGMSCFRATYWLARLKMSEIIFTGRKTQIKKKKKIMQRRRIWVQVVRKLKQFLILSTSSLFMYIWSTHFPLLFKHYMYTEPKK